MFSKSLLASFSFLKFISLRIICKINSMYLLCGDCRIKSCMAQTKTNFLPSNFWSQAFSQNNIKLTKRRLTEKKHSYWNICLLIIYRWPKDKDIQAPLLWNHVMKFKIFLILDITDDIGYGKYGILSLPVSCTSW